LTCRLFGQHLPVFGTWLYRSLRATMPAREWSLAKAQFAILFGERFTRAMA
jgi:hypothetical protein